MLVAALSLWAFAAVLRRPSTLVLAAWAVAGGLAVAVHYFAGFLIAAEAVWLLAAVRPVRPVVIATLPLVAAACALAPLALDQADRHDLVVPGDLSVARRVATVLVQFMLGERLSIRGVYTLTPLIALGVAGVIAGLIWLARRRGQRIAVAIGVVSAAAWIVPILFEVAGKDYFNGRNTIASLVGFLVLAGVVLAAPASGRRGLAVAGALACLGLVMSVAVNTVERLQRLDFRAAAAELGGPKDARALVVASGGDDPLLVYMSDSRIRILTVPAPVVSEVAVVGQTSTTAPPTRPPSGFRRGEQQRVPGLTVTRFVAPRARAVSRAELEALSPDANARLLLDGG
jgi:hypothetical protein